jgi:tetratricopeptide (TPR) repeat protein
VMLIFIFYYSSELTTAGVLTEPSPIIQSPLQWFLLNLEVITRYLMMLCWPVNLSIAYHEPSFKTLFENIPFLLMSLTLFIMIILAALFLRRRDSNLQIFLISWFFITLTPYLNIAGVNILLADRYLYLPAFGVIALAALSLSTLYNRCVALENKTPRYFKYIVILMSMSICSLYTTITMQTIKVWENTETLFSNATRVAPRRFAPYRSLAKYYLEIYEARPKDPNARVLLAKAKIFAETAYQLCERRNGKWPRLLPGIIYMLGKINFFEGNFMEAEEYIEDVLDFDDKNIFYLYTYSYVLAYQEKYEHSIDTIDKIKQLADPKYSKAILEDIDDHLLPMIAEMKNNSSLNSNENDTNRIKTIY